MDQNEKGHQRKDSTPGPIVQGVSTRIPKSKSSKLVIEESTSVIVDRTMRDIVRESKFILIPTNRNNIDIFQEKRMMIGHHDNHKDFKPRAKELTFVDIIQNTENS